VTFQISQKVRPTGAMTTRPVRKFARKRAISPFRRVPCGVG